MSDIDTIKQIDQITSQIKNKKTKKNVNEQIKTLIKIIKIDTKFKLITTIYNKDV